MRSSYSRRLSRFRRWRSRLAALDTAAESTQGPESSPGRGEVGRYHRVREPRRAEVRRHLGRRPRPHQGRRRAHRRDTTRRDTTSWSWSRPWARRPTTSSGWRTRSRTSRRAARWTCCSPSGERISIALLCMAIIDRGEHAVSFTGSQAGIVTDTTHGKAKILDVAADRLRETVADGAVAVVAGFQGVSTASDITTLGRGGSDTTAVALAAALGAESCEIYTDVAGVFTADPRIVPEARKLDRVSYEEMLDMAATGGRVLALRSVEFARNYGVPDARPLELHVGAGHAGSSRGGSGDGAGDHLGRHARHVRGEGDDRPCARPARRRRARVPGARRRGGERRHDRAERRRPPATPTSRSRCRARTSPVRSR